MPGAIILFSGGLDSTTVLKMAKNSGWDIYALSFNYGQNHQYELECAKNIIKKVGVNQHLIVDLDMRRIGGSALTDFIEIPKNRNEKQISSQIPSTYVPARNTIFLSFGLAWAETLHITDIFMGVNAVDYSGYPDCRPAFIEAFEKMANLATKVGVEGDEPLTIHTPLINLNKAQIIEQGLKHKVDFALTNSCYDPAKNGTPCQQCDSCQLREKGFRELNIPDPLLTV